MQGWRRYTIIAVLAFLVGVAVWSSMAWSDTVNFDVPRGKPAPPPVKVECGHLFGSGPSSSTHVAAVNGYKPSHKPCSGRTDRRILVVLDAIVGIAALVVLLTRFSVHDPFEASNTSS